MEGSDLDRRMKRIALGVAVVLLCAFAVTRSVRLVSEHRLAHRSAARASALPRVEVVAVKPAGAAQSLTLPGETHGWYESTIFARVDGYVARWYVDIGDHVAAGQVLAEIETPELDARLAAARAQLKVARANVAVKEAEAGFARTTYDRWRDAEPGVVSKQETEEKKAGFGSTVARLEAARAQVARDQAEVDHDEALERFKRVTAPYAGIVIERSIDIGNLVSAGSSSGTTPLYRVAQDDPMRVWVDAPQAAQADLMRPGAAAKITTSLDPAHPIEGRIARASGAIHPRSRTFRVEIDVPNPKRVLVPGMYVQVAFHLATSGMLEVPAAALLFRSTGPQVAVVDAEGRVRLRDVGIARDDGQTVLLDSGVSAGEKVALNLSSEVTAGEKVSAHEANERLTANAKSSPAP